MASHLVQRQDIECFHLVNSQTKIMLEEYGGKPRFFVKSIFFRNRLGHGHVYRFKAMKRVKLAPVVCNPIIIACIT